MARGFDALRVRRVQVIEDDDRAATFPRDVAHPIDNAFEGEQAQLRLGQLGFGAGVRPLRQHQLQPAIERRRPNLRRVVALPRPQRLRDDTERQRSRDGRAPNQDGSTGGPSSARGLAQQSRLTDTALTDEDDDDTATTAGGVDSGPQAAGLDRSADRRATQVGPCLRPMRPSWPVPERDATSAGAIANT
jgi:hypothetical protein